nr:hypothetical protein [Tanacetum cinerariifolium]
MSTRSSSSNLVGESSPNPTSSNLKCYNCRRSKQPFILEESPIDTMADQRTIEELLRAPTEGYAEAVVVPIILAEHFELKHSLINMMTSNQFFRLEKDNPRDHIRRGSPSLARKEPSRSFLTWEDLVSKFINEFFPLSRTTNLRNEISNFQQRFDESFHEAWDRYKDLFRACPHHGFIELHQLDTFYNVLNPADQDFLNSAAGGNLLERRTQDVLKIIKNKSKIAKLTHAVNQQTSAVTTAMTAILKQFQATPPLAFVKAIEEICATFGGAYPPLPSNTIVNPKGELKAITTRSGLVLDGPSVPMPPPFINPAEDERVEETLTDPDLAEYTIKVPPPLVQKAKPHSQRNYVVYQRDPLHPNISYPLRINTKKMLKALLSNKEKLLELENTPLNENYSTVILKKLPEKLGDPGKFLIPCGFSELKYKALANLVINPLSGNSTSSSLDQLLEEFADELALITFPLGNDDLPFDIESEFKKLEYLLNHDPIKEMDSILEDSVDKDNIAYHNNNLFDTILEMFTDEHTLDYSSPPLYDDFDDDLFELI